RRTVSPAVRKKEAKARDVVAMRRLRHRAAAVGEDALIPNAAESVAAGVPRHDKTDPTLGLEQERRRNGITLDRVAAQAPACRASIGLATPETRAFALVVCARPLLGGSAVDSDERMSSAAPTRRT